MMDDGDLQIHVRFDELQLSVIHEGKSGDLMLQQASLLQLSAAWRELLAETFASRVEP